MASISKDSKHVTKIINRIMERWSIYPSVYEELLVIAAVTDSSSLLTFFNVIALFLFLVTL